MMKDGRPSSNSHASTTKRGLLVYIIAIIVMTSSPQSSAAFSLSSLFVTPGSNSFSRRRTEQQQVQNDAKTLFKTQQLLAVSNSNNFSNENSSNNRNNKRIRRFPVVPMIGPIITAPPLMIGSEMTLNPPTPLQWKALQECVVVHQNQLKQEEDDKNKNSSSSSSSSEKQQQRWEGTTATIDAAPIIAIIDETTGLSRVKPPYSNIPHGGRYATLAAVVGIRSNIQRSSTLQEDEEEEENFMEYMDLSNNNYYDEDDDDDDFIVPMDSSVRLVGIGRAVLRDYFYRVPTELCSISEDDDDIDDDEECEVEMEDLPIDQSLLIEEDFNYNYNIDNDNDGYEDNTPIVMAEFEPLVDDASIYAKNDPEKVGDKGVGSYRSSPVHAMAELSNVYQKVNRMHLQRMRLVAGLKAANARLEISRQRRENGGNFGNDDGLIDYDGLGSLFASKDDENDKSKQEKDEEIGMTVDEFLSTFKGNMQRIDPSELPQNQPTETEKLASLENFGLNYYGAFSTIPELTSVAVKLMEPYYSKAFREREEHEIEVSSFVAFRALEGFAHKEDVAKCLHCTSSIERLELAYEIMVHHQAQLKKLAEEISDRLRNCGEECTDLW